MKPNRKNALCLWQKRYGQAIYAYDFDGGLMFRDAYGDAEYFVYQGNEKVYCGWNLHHILPIAKGGSNDESNLLCTNIITNEQAGDKITFWIDDSLYQVKRIRGTGRHEIVKR